MPEIKNNFLQGKMNKDLDERLVPNGQYRHALNVDVTTSDEAGIGTVQNLLGNTEILPYLSVTGEINVPAGTTGSYINDQLFDENSSCVGSIKDDKNNALYWFVKGNDYTGFSFNDGELITPILETPYKDMILQYKDNILTPVVVDIWGSVHQIDLFTTPSNTVTITSGDGVYVGMSAHGVYVDLSNEEVVDNYTDLIVTSITEVGSNFDIEFNRVVDVSTINYLVFTNPKCLNLKRNSIITGINIVDDMLFWTDNFSEPKKINIPRSIEGTHAAGNTHTNIINKFRDIDNNNDVTPMREQHITVIKKAPKNPPVLEMNDGRRPGVVYGSAEYDFQGKSIGDTFTLRIHHPPGAGIAPNMPKFNLYEGDELVLKYFEEPDSPPVPLFEHDIRVIISSVINNEGGNFLFADFSCRIITMNPGTPTGGSCVDASTGNPVTLFTDQSSCELANYLWESPKFIVDLFDETAKESQRLFEFKFPRFAYRYKYEDGEYSTMSPFSEIAFLPGNFDYHPTKGFNLGMVNTLTSLYIKELVTPDIPEDVVEIDILYKESVSPNVYIVDTIKYKDPLDANGVNEWKWVNRDYNSNKLYRDGRYQVESEIIYATLPENQSLRLWDNVPRKALAQEVVGSRLIFGNYIQNFDLIDSDNQLYKPNFNTSLSTFDTDDFPVIKKPKKSLKSIREYQLGVVYSDAYGRETPILTNNTGILRVPKIYGGSSNQIEVRLTGTPPNFADSFKFFVKETSSEYYNLAMDRWYSAEDGNVWLSFPSSERDKLDIDTFLILKKGADSSELVSEEARYKILDIQNEAPEFIKRDTVVLGYEDHYNDPVNITGATVNDVFGNNSPDFPLENRNYFIVNLKPFNGGDTGLMNIHKLLDKDGFVYVRFASALTEQVSKDYRVSDISTDPVNVTTQNQDTAVVRIQIDGNFRSDVNFIHDDFAGEIFDATRVFFLRKKPENSPRFDGRFFVKIYNDDLLKEAIGQGINEDTKYRVISSKKVYHMHPNFNDDHAQLNGAIENGLMAVAGLTTLVHDWHHYAYYLRGGYHDHLDSDELTGRVTNAAVNATGGEYQDVWFIDGMVKAGRSYDGFWDTGGYPDGLPDIQAIGGMGIKQMGNYESGSSIMDLSFGPINKDSRLDYTQMYGFWNVIDDGNGVSAHYASANQFAKNLVPGSKIRWKEDPQGTIYIIQGLVNQMNFRYEDFHDDNNNGFMDHPVEGKYPWNRTRLFRLILDKRMTWNPITGEGMDFNNQTVMNGYSPNTDHLVGSTQLDTATYPNNDIQTAIGYTLEIVEPVFDDEILPEEPAIWETEPKESVDIDIYYEASSNYPIVLNEDNMYNIIRVGSVVTIPKWLIEHTSPGVGPTVLPNSGIQAPSGQNIPNLDGVLDIDVTVKSIEIVEGNFKVNLDNANANGNLKLSNANPDRNDRADIVEFKKDDTGISFSIKESTDAVDYIIISQYVHNNPIQLDWHNCYTFSNGVESDRIKDTFNSPTIDMGAKASTTLAEPYKEERRKYGLIYSGLYSSTAGSNSLNQFIMGEKITKDLNPVYGSIQKLFTRRTDIIALCEDRVLNILANKDAVFNADGDASNISSFKVLGVANAYDGEYGISTNPESFASESYRAYFTDKSRGAVLRLSKDGLTPISDSGMRDFFKDNLRIHDKLVGTYDNTKRDYNLSMYQTTTASEVDAHLETDIELPVWNPPYSPPQPSDPIGPVGGFIDDTLTSIPITGTGSGGQDDPNDTPGSGSVAPQSVIIPNCLLSSVPNDNTGGQTTYAVVAQFEVPEALMTNSNGATIAIGWDVQQHGNAPGIIVTQPCNVTNVTVVGSTGYIQLDNTPILQGWAPLWSTYTSTTPWTWLVDIEFTNTPII